MSNDLKPALVQISSVVLCYRMANYLIVMII